MISQLRPAFVMLLIMTLLTGLAYPFAMTGIANAVFPHQATSSLVTKDGAVVGSELIGQAFADARYFHSRPSAAGDGYNAASSSGSNLGPTSKKLMEEVSARTAPLAEQSGGNRVPADLVTASGSGLDPHVSPESANLQIARVAAARSMPEADIRALVDAQTTGRWLGLFGSPHVNVLMLNLALDQAAPPAPEGGAVSMQENGGQR